MSGTVHFQPDGGDGIARVVLDNAGKLNAIDIAMWHELRRVFDALQAHPAVDAPRAVIVAGAAGHFASGGDIVEFATFRFDETKLHDFHENTVAPALRAMLACDIPLFAQIDGACIGGGFEIAACCDIRVCGEASRFGAPIAKLGFPMAPGELELLARVASPAVLREMLGPRVMPKVIRPDVPVVLRIYDRRLGSAVARRFGFDTVRSTVDCFSNTAKA